MHRTRSLLFAAIALALGAAITLAPTAHATVMVEIPLEDLVRDADAIVLGTVERVGVRLQMDPDGQGMDPHTITVVRVSEWLKGSANDLGSASDLVTIDELGGVMGEMGLRIDGTPEYRPNQRVVVFLHRVDGRLRTLQMAQGAFEVLPGVPGTPSIVQRDLEAIGLARWTEGQMSVEHGGRSAMRLDDFLAFVRATLTNLELSGDAVGGAR